MDCLASSRDGTQQQKRRHSWAWPSIASPPPMPSPGMPTSASGWGSEANWQPFAPPARDSRRKRSHAWPHRSRSFCALASQEQTPRTGSTAGRVNSGDYCAATNCGRSGSPTAIYLYVAPRPLWDGDRRHDLLLIVRRIAAVVVRAHEREEVERAARRVAKVIANEAETAPDAGWTCGAELWIPAVRREPNVVAIRGERRRVPLDRGVHAVIGRTVRRHAPRPVGVSRVERQTGTSRLARPSCGTGKAPIVKGKADRAARRDGEIRLELIRWRGIVIHLDWPA